MTRKTDAAGSMRRALDRVKTHFHEVRFGKPATKQELVELEARTGTIPKELVELYRITNGVRVRTEDEGVDGTLFSTREARREFTRDSPRLVPIGHDGCGNYDCVLRGKGPGEGAVVFWDHDDGGISHLIAPSVSRYVELFAEDLVKAVSPDGVRDFDVELPEKRDPEARALLDDPKFQALLVAAESDGDGDDDDDDDDDEEDPEHRSIHLAALVADLPRSTRIAVEKHFAKASATELRALRDELRAMARRECLLVILEASGAKIPTWLRDLIHARASASNLHVSYAAAGESANLVESIRLS